MRHPNATDNANINPIENETKGQRFKKTKEVQPNP
jgi:hypothetical protein